MILPPIHYGTLFGKYPRFTVNIGDCLRAMLICQIHNFCDVEFGLEYYNAQEKPD